MFAIKTTNNDLEIELPPQEIIRFEYYKLQGEDFDQDSVDEDYSPPVNKAEEVIKNLQLDHLNPEKDHVPINTRPHRFSLSQKEDVE